MSEPEPPAPHSPAPTPPAHPADDHRHPDGWRVSPSPDGRGTPPGNPPRYPWKTAVAVVLVMLTVQSLVFSSLGRPAPRVRVPYSPYFLNRVRAGEVQSVSTKGSTVQGEFTHALRYPANDAKATRTKHFATEVPVFADTRELTRALEARGVVVNAHPPSTGQGFLKSLLIGLVPTLLLVAAFVWLARRAAAGGGLGGLGGFGRSRARRVEPSQQRLTFADVAGIDEVKDELSQIVDFLKDPDRYRKLGGRIPRGVLLTGPPGTGKTLLARALAGEAQVPFFSISASEFVEMYVGVGASRVRDLFEQAKATAPAIIFIDELDAIGRSRAGAINPGGGNDEREQTLNQILTEMDGFDPSIGVIVLSATNRPEVLDRALLRPGRFDRRIAVQPPDTTGRKAILEVHTRSVPLDAGVDLGQIAATTTGMVGADLANVVNEGALLAARRDHEAVSMDDLLDALERLVLGTERRILLSSEERRRTAYHEAGHAAVGMLTPGADPIRKISIVPRGISLGMTLSAPGADRFSYDRDYLEASIRVALGGRVAEELVFASVTSGAESDIRQLTEIARNMVTRWGMSDAIGPVATVPPEDGVLMPAIVSPDLQYKVDQEVRRIAEEAHAQVTALLLEHRDVLDRLAGALLEHETLDEPEAYAAAGLPVAESGERPALPVGSGT